MRRKGNPKKFELVVCRISKIFPHSAIAEMVEYRKTGLIHVSEVALRWVKNIREFLKVNQFVVCQVAGVKGDDVLLSVKRVRREESDRKLNEYKRESKAEKALELTAKSLGKSLDQAYDEVGYLLQEEFGSIRKGLEFAHKNPGLLEEKGVPKAWLEPLKKTASKSFSDKDYSVRAKLRMVCYGPEGVSIIRKSLQAAEKDGLEARYISAPNYELIGKGKNIKELRAKVQGAAEGISRELSSHKGSCEFEIKESR